MKHHIYNAEILSVGTELLLGHVTNTDARDLSRMLSEIGINVKYHTVVGDNAERLRECVEIAGQRSDIIITTGGLGSTCDDLTKKVLSDVFGRKLAMNETERQYLLDYYSTRDYTEQMVQDYLSQAMLPEGSTVFHNLWGMAPGCAFESAGTIVMMLPGPPKECIPMFQRYGMPFLQQLSDDMIVSHTINVLGIAESKLDTLFREEMNGMTNPSMAPYAREADCMLKVTAKAKTKAEAARMMQPVMDHCLSVLGDLVYGIDVDSVEEAVFQLLSERNMTLAAAEGCTGGELAKRFTDLPGASALFKGGIVLYQPETAETVLGMDPGSLSVSGALSESAALEMAERVRAKFHADLGLAALGVAGPGQVPEHPVGEVIVALASKNLSYAETTRYSVHRTRSFIRCAAANKALDLVRRLLTDRLR